MENFESLFQLCQGGDFDIRQKPVRWKRSALISFVDARGSLRFEMVWRGTIRSGKERLVYGHHFRRNVDLAIVTHDRIQDVYEIRIDLS